jgi:hypothetical protein
VRGLNNGTTYLFRVTATDADGKEYVLRPVEATPAFHAVATGNNGHSVRDDFGAVASPKTAPRPAASPVPAAAPDASSSPPPLVSVSIVVPNATADSPGHCGALSLPDRESLTAQ